MDDAGFLPIRDVRHKHPGRDDIGRFTTESLARGLVWLHTLDRTASRDSTQVVPTAAPGQSLGDEMLEVKWQTSAACAEIAREWIKRRFVTAEVRS
jgi:hypothetical protein